MPRKFVKPVDNEEQQPNFGPRPWNLLAEIAIYARQSTTKQTVENKESSEAQTKDQLDKVRAIGWSDDSITLFIEGDGKRGVSGKLRIDKRTGLNALVEGIYAGKFKYVFVTNEGRLFRDETMIGPDTFIDACKTHDVIVVTDVYRYDFRNNPFASDQFRMQCQIAARFITDHVGMMNRMRDRVAKRGQYFGGGIGIGYILDKENRPIPYEPHAKIIKWIFKQYRQLNGNVTQLARELNAEGPAFPAYEAGVKGPYTHLTVTKGGYAVTRAGVISILTNVQYIGYWSFKKQIRRDESGQPIINHPPIVDQEDFWYVFNRLSPTTIDGELNEERETITRYEQDGSVPSRALLKFVIVSPHGKVYASKERQKKKKCQDADEERETIKEMYSIKYNTPDYSTLQQAARFDISLLDTAFVNKMFEHLMAWKAQEEASHVGAMIEEELEKESAKEEKVSPTQVIDNQLAKLQPKIAHYKRLVDNGYGLEEEDLKEYAAQLAKLRRSEKELLAARESIEKEEQDRQESQELVDNALERWNKYRLDQKRNVIKTTVTQVLVMRISPSWLKVEITWKGIGGMLPTTDFGYLWLCGSANKDWTPEELTILKTMYPSEPADAILEKLPDRAWFAIKAHAYRKKIQRHVFKSPTDKAANYLSLEDRKFMEQMGIDTQEVRRGYDGQVFWSDREAMLYPAETEMEIDGSEYGYDDEEESGESEEESEDGEGNSGLVTNGKYEHTSRNSPHHRRSGMGRSGGSGQGPGPALRRSGPSKRSRDTG